MQVLKEDVRYAIIESGVKHFYEFGFEKASIRKIVKDASTTIGNFYNYFQSKEDLFYTIVTPAYNDFVHFIKTHNEEEAVEIDLESMDLKEIKNMLNIFFESSYNVFNNRLVILLDGSKGTKYENIKGEIIELLSGHFTEHLSKQSTLKKLSYYSEFSNVIGKSFLEGILYILRSDNEEDIKKVLLVDYIVYYIYGGMIFINQ